MNMSFERVLRAREHRILCKLRRYRRLPEKVISVVLPSLSDDEAVWGVYENADNIQENVIVTAKGIHLFVDGWILLHYSQIESARVLLDEQRDKRAADTILLQMQSGEVFSLKIVGGDSRARDVWAVARFLHRVIWDYRVRTPRLRRDGARTP